MLPIEIKFLAQRFRSAQSDLVCSNNKRPQITGSGTVAFHPAVCVYTKRVCTDSRKRVGLIRQIKRSVSVCMAQRRLAAGGHQVRNQDRDHRLLIIVTTAICWHTSTRTGTITIDLMWYLLMSLESASTAAVVVLKFSTVLLTGQRIVAPKIQDDQSGRSWHWAYQQISPVLMVPVLVFSSCMPTWGGGGGGAIIKTLVLGHLSRCLE